MSSNEFEMGAECLGHPGVVANWWRTAAGDTSDPYQRPQVTIFEAAVADEHVHYPAASITIRGREALSALRAVVDAALLNEPNGESK